MRATPQMGAFTCGNKVDNGRASLEFYNECLVNPKSIIANVKKQKLGIHSQQLH